MTESVSRKRARIAVEVMFCDHGRLRYWGWLDRKYLNMGWKRNAHERRASRRVSMAARRMLARRYFARGGRKGWRQDFGHEVQREPAGDTKSPAGFWTGTKRVLGEGER